MNFTVRDIMTEHIATVSPSDNLDHAVSLLLRHGISGVPVTDEHGRLCGILSEYDLLLHLTRPATSQELVSRYMTEIVETVGPEDSVEDVVRLFGRLKYRRLPVVEDGTLLGVVGRRDVMRLIVSAAGIAGSPVTHV